MTVPVLPAGAGKGSTDGGDALIGSAGLMLVGTAAGAALAMLNEVLAARFLGVASYGLYALAILLTKSSEVVAVFGVPVSLMHYLPVYLNRGQRAEALGTMIGAIPGPLAVGTVLAFGLWFGSDWIAAHLLGQPGAGNFIAVLAFAIPLLVLLDILGHGARAFGKTLPFVLIERLSPQLCVTAALTTLLLWHGPQIGVAFGQLFGVAAGVIVGVVLVGRICRVAIGRVRPVLQLRRLYGYAFPMLINNLLSLAVAWTDLLLLGLLSDADTVGIYRGCMQFALVFDLVWNALAAAGAPLFSVLIADGGRQPLQQTYSTAMLVAALVACPILAAVMLNASDLLGLLGPRFAEGWIALIVLSVGHAVRVVFSAAFVVLIVGGRQRLDACNVAVAAILNVLLNLMLIPSLGPLGAALSTAASLICLAIMRCVQVHRLLTLHTFEAPLPRVLLVTVPPVLAAWAAAAALDLRPGSGLGALALRLALLAALLASALWWFGLRPDDRTSLLRLLRTRPGSASSGAKFSPG